MARTDRAESLDMTEGDRVRERRERLGMDKKRLATEAGVSRETLAAIESGQGYRRSTMQAIEAALKAAEDEAGMSTPPSQSNEGLIEFEVSGDFGVRVVVRGPVSDAEHLEDSVGRIIRKIRAGEAEE